jgi:hypothetical protein
MPKLIAALVFIAVLIAAYFAMVLNWNYSAGERAGWLQKLSYKGFVCKTWEGELALVSLPGSSVEKFLFTVRDDAVANKLQAAMGKRVSLHYEEKVGLPTSCFGETRYFITGVSETSEIPLGPGVVVNTTPSEPAASAP